MAVLRMDQRTKTETRRAMMEMMMLIGVKTLMSKPLQKRMEELSVGAKGLMHTNELEKSSQERLQIFFDYVQVSYSIS